MNRSEGQWAQPELSYTAHRAINGPVSKAKGLGTHYSADANIAEGIAESNKQPEDFFYKPRHTTIIHTEIPVSSVETDKKKLMNNSVWSINDLSKNSEKEIPVKPGSPVRVTGKTTIKATAPYDLDSGKKIEPRKSRTRTRKYNPPREMKA